MRAAVCLLVALLLLLVPPGAAAQQTGRGAFEAVYAPGGPMRVGSPDGLVALDLAAGAATEPLTFAYSRLTSAPTTGGRARLAKTFRLEAKTTGGGRPVSRLARPLKLVVTYADADLAALGGVQPAALKLYYKEARTDWTVLPSTVDSTARTVTATVDHLTDFGVGTDASATATPGPTDTPAPTNTPWPTGASDTFGRPDGGPPLGVADSGQAWDDDNTPWTICASAACPKSPDDDQYVRIQTNLSAQRVAVTVLPRSATATGQAALILGVTPDWNTNLLYVGLDGTGKVEVWTLTGGGTWSSGPIASAATGMDGSVARRLEAQASGSTLDVYVDGAHVLGPTTVPAIPSNGTFAGIYGGTHDADPAIWPRFDDFYVGAAT